MLIDWFTVGAQVLNFLILVWLLKRFLYRPILDAIDARERKIAAELAAAEAKMAAADDERAAFAARNATFDKTRQEALDAATAAAAAERQRLIDAARQEAATLSARSQESLRREASVLQREIGRWAGREVFAIARRALGDLAGVTLEERLVEVFIGRLQALADGERQALAAALQAGLPAQVRTAGALPAALQARLEQAIRDLLGTSVPVIFVVVPEQSAGIELATDGHKLAWGVDEYLAQLEQGVGDLVRGGPLAPAKDANDA